MDWLSDPNRKVYASISMKNIVSFIAFMKSNQLRVLIKAH